MGNCKEVQNRVVTVAVGTLVSSGGGGGKAGLHTGQGLPDTAGVPLTVQWVAQQHARLSHAIPFQQRPSCTPKCTGQHTQCQSHKQHGMHCLPRLRACSYSYATVDSLKLISDHWGSFRCETGSIREPNIKVAVRKTKLPKQELQGSGNIRKSGGSRPV